MIHNDTHFRSWTKRISLHRLPTNTRLCDTCFVFCWGHLTSGWTRQVSAQPHHKQLSYVGPQRYGRGFLDSGPLNESRRCNAGCSLASWQYDCYLMTIVLLFFSALCQPRSSNGSFNLLDAHIRTCCSKRSARKTALCLEDCSKLANMLLQKKSDNV